MLDSIKVALSNHPFKGVGASIGGYILSLSDMLSPFLRFLILIFSTVTAISVAYVQYNKAWSMWNVKSEKDPSKKGNSNSR